MALVEHARIARLTPAWPKSGSIATISPLKICFVARSPIALTLISTSLPSPNLHHGVDVLALGIGDPDHRRVRQRERVAHADLGEQVAVLLLDRSAVDGDGDAGDVIGGVGHQPSSLGRLSARPRWWSRFSMPLASAIERQTVASPYAS